jgi:hypothetical protein
MRVDQLAQVLVAAGDHGVDPALGRHARQRSDDVVGLDARHVQHLPSQQLHHLVDRRDLRAQVVGHRRTVGLVLGIQVVAEGLARCVEHARRIVGAHVPAQLLHHVDHPADRAGGGAGWVARDGPQVGHGVEGAVQIARAVDQEQCFSRNKF